MVRIVAVENKKIVAIDHEYRVSDKFITYNIPDDIELDLDWFKNDISTASYLMDFLSDIEVERIRPITLYLDSNYSSIPGLFNTHYLNIELRTVRSNITYYQKQLKNIVGYDSFEEVVNSEIDRKYTLNIYIINNTNIKVVTDILTNDLNRKEILLVLDRKLPLYCKLRNLDYDIIKDIEYYNEDGTYRNIVWLKQKKQTEQIFEGRGEN